MRMAKNATLIGAVAAAVVLGAAAEGLACGDKFLVLGRGIRNRIPKAAHPASIVLYVRPGSQVAGSAKALKLHPSLAQAGHRLREVRTADELAAALRDGADVVLVDVAGIAEVSDMAQALAPNARVLPLVDKRIDDVKAAQARFPHPILVPSAPASYLKVIDSALHARQASR